MWTQGAMRIGDTAVTWQIKHFEEPSQFGIDEGRISKLTIKHQGKDIVNFDRGWDKRPEDEVGQQALQKLLKRYN